MGKEAWLEAILSRMRGPFPRLEGSGFSVTSPVDARYNCIGWAAGDNRRWWWPSPRYFWPKGTPREETLEAFVAAYRTIGFLPTTSRTHEPGVEKVAIYADDFQRPRHAARQLPNGRWTSKLGRDVDIEHSLHDLEGPAYGTVAIVLARTAQEPDGDP